MGADLASNRFLQFMGMAVNNPTILHDLNELRDDDMAGLLKIASEAGFQLSAEEVNAVANEMQLIGSPDGELSEEDLEVVMGGTNNNSQLQSMLTNILKKFHDQNMASIHNAV